MFMQNRAIAVEASVCTGCRACEAACVFFHENALGTSAARVRVRKDEAEGLDEPKICRLCDEPSCIPACPAGALSRAPGLGTIHLDRDLCNACGLCLEACSHRSIAVDPRDAKPMFCDLCGGRPACVDRCSPGALKFESEAS